MTYEASKYTTIIFKESCGHYNMIRQGVHTEVKYMWKKCGESKI